MKCFISMVVMCCFLLTVVPSFAQDEENKKKSEPLAVEFIPIKSEILIEDYLVQKFGVLLKMDEEIKGIDAHLRTLGFSPQGKKKGVQNFWGARETYQSQSKVDKKSITFTVHLQSYAKPGSKDSMAIGQVIVNAGDRSETYSFYLSAPNRNFEAMEEYTMDKKLRLSKANSWWSCVKSDIRKRCATTCLSSLITCAPSASTIVGYVACVAIQCGGCATKSIACCSCDCSWWCKWAVGCCDR
ncbi:MAG: hypothetical protein QG657_334 [Acidobacteriota bacterium]|nr:hypothetical protein [Acidobacteriota bacterium]